MPLIPAAQEAEIRKITDRSQTRQIVFMQDPISKKPSQKRLVEWLKW
jgi:hypothetical protein